ncbi:SIS domain-containing protein [Candidatus Latescibacterota bacterium]
MDGHITELINRYPLLKGCADDIEQVFFIMLECYMSGGKVLICGNGGSAADAEHWAGELMKGFIDKRPVPADKMDKLGPELSEHLQGALPTIPLTGYISLSTAFANDVNAVYLYSQLVWGLGNEKDVLIGISTSGNAENILYAMQTAAAKGMKTIGLSGESGGKMNDISDICINVPETEVHRIQEYHLPVYHTICLMLEDALFGGQQGQCTLSD